MKKKLLFLMALILSIGAWAQQSALTADKGWTKISAMPEDPNPYFFAMFDKVNGGTVVLHDGIQQGGFKTMTYQADVNPETNKAALWTLPKDGDKYLVVNQENAEYFQQTEWNAGWLWRNSDNGGGDPSWGNAEIEKSDDYFMIKQVKYPNYAGPWDSKYGDDFAGNKNANDAAKMYFYTIERGRYIANTINISTASMGNPIDLSYAIINANASINRTSGWTMEWLSETHSNGYIFQTQANAGLANAPGLGARFFESWQQEGGLSNRQMYQTLNGVPNGKYRLTVITDCDAAGAYLFGNDTRTELKDKNSDRVVTTIVEVNNNTLKFGIVLDGYQASWIKFDKFTLEAIGAPGVNVDKSELTSALEEAKTLYGQFANADLKNAIDAAEVVADNTSATQNDIDNAASALKTVLAAVKVLKAKEDTYNEVNAKDAGADITSILVNPSFETGNLNGWTDNSANGMWTMMTRANDADPKVGNYWVEKYANAGKIDISQTISYLPAGVYRVSVLALDQASKTKLIVKSGEYTSETVIAGGNKADYSAELMIEDKSDITIGLYAETHQGNSWVGFDNFRLTLVSKGMPELTAVEGAMNKDAKSNMDNAIAAYNADKTVAKYNAAQAAIATAQTSANAYKMARYFIDQAQSAKGSVFTTSNATDYATAVAALEAKYINGEFTNAEANDRIAMIGERQTGLVPEYMLGGWNSDLYINTWSIEGDNDGSNYKTPFYEYWVGDGENLANKTISASLTGMESGLYAISADVRVRAKNGVSVTEATGINLVANDGKYDGEEGNGTVDATEGTQIGQSQMSKSTVTAYTLVKDGVLTANFVVADCNISWLAFQNVKYTKVRELTDEEKAVIPTAVTLNTTEAKLTAANNTVTITPSFTPENATQTVSWTTSDANVAVVANGVVTGVAPGTATITVTSTLDENVKASCTVTVEYSEAAVPETYIVKANKKITTYTLASENIVKNGAFEYGNHFYGHNGGNSAELASPNWAINNDNGNYYITSTASAGAGDAKSYSTHWPIESGKKYIFGYSIKHSNGVTAMDYLKTSLDKDGDYQEDKVLSTAFDVPTTWQDMRYVVDNTDGTYGYVQLRGRWLGAGYDFDNFFLAEVTSISEVDDVEEAKAALKNEIDDYVVPSTNIGDAAFQYSESGIEAVQNTIDAAQAIYDKADATLAEVEQAIANMKALTNPELNIPDETDKYNVAIVWDGYRYSGNPLQLNANLMGGVTVPLTESINNDLNKWNFTKVEGVKNGYNMSVLYNDVRYYVCTGAQDNGANDAQIRLTQDPAKALTVIVKATETEGIYNFLNSRSNNAIIGCQDDRETDGGWYTVNSHATHSITLVNNAATATMYVNPDAKYGTFCAPFDVEIPAGVTVSKATEINEKGLITLEDITGVIPANTPVILYAENEVNETFEGEAVEIEGNPVCGILTGVYEKTYAPDDSYVMQMNEGKVGFYYVATEETIYVPANRCYMTKPAGVEVREAYFFDIEDETAVESIEAKAATLADGKYLINGKIVVVKAGKAYDLTGK